MRGLWAASGCRKPFHAPAPRQDGSAALLLAPPKQVSELLATPPLPVVLAVELLLAHSVWLKMLKPSARNCREMDSWIGMFLYRAISKFRRLGLFRKFLPVSPKVRPCGAAKAAGL